MGAGAANPLIQIFREQELFGKIKLYTFDISPEVLDSIIAGEMGFGMDAQQYLMGYLPVIYLVEHGDARLLADQQHLHRAALRRHAGEGQGDPDAGQGGHPLARAASRRGRSRARRLRPVLPRSTLRFERLGSQMTAVEDKASHIGGLTRRDRFGMRRSASAAPTSGSPRPAGSPACCAGRRPARPAA